MDADTVEVDPAQDVEEKVVVGIKTGRPHSNVWDWFTNVVVQEVQDGNPLAKKIKRSQCLHCRTQISSRAFRLKAHLLKCKASADAGVPIDSFDFTPRATDSVKNGKVGSLKQIKARKRIIKVGAGASTASLKYYDELHRALGTVQVPADAEDRSDNVDETVDDNSEDYSPSRQVRARARSDCDPVEQAILAHLENARKKEPKDNVQLFLDSLAEPMRRLTPKQFALARIKIDSIMYEITYESNEPVVA